MWTYNYSNELYHHGVRGMKWGVRRYQNPDGSLTPRGEKRLAKLQSKADKLTGANNKSSVGGAYKQKGSGKITKRGEDLSNEEIDAALARKRKVDEYNRVFAEPPKAKKNSWAKDAAKDAANALKGVAIEKGKQQLGKYLETKLSDMLGTKDVLAEMKKETERLTAEVNLQNAKNNLKNSKFNRDNADLANEANVAALKSKKAAGINNEYKQTKEYNEAVARDKAAAEEAAKAQAESKNKYALSIYSRTKEQYGDWVIDLSDDDFKIRHDGVGKNDMWTYNYSNELYHHGVKGQKWGVRRYQNADGTLTDKGKKRYRADSVEGINEKKKMQKYLNDASSRRSQELATADTAKIATSKYMKKAEKKMEKGKVPNEKLINKVRSSEKEYDNAVSNRWKSEAAVQNGLTQASKMGFKVISNVKLRSQPAKATAHSYNNVTLGKRIATAAAQTALSNAALQLMGAPYVTAVTYTGHRHVEPQEKFKIK